jgi:hypothetical protein
MKNVIGKRTRNLQRLALALALVSQSALAEETYSPYVDQAHPDRVYWGDTHVHSSLSADAYAMGSRVTPDTAYRFAKGETVTTSSAQTARLSRPLDFLMVADHAENMGVMSRIAAGDPDLLSTEHGKNTARGFKDNTVPTRDVINAKTAEEHYRLMSGVMSVKNGWKLDYGVDERFRRSIWDEVIETAEQHNDPGTFTAFIGFEWSGDVMLHRNVIFEGGPEQARQTFPYSNKESQDVEDLWAYLDEFDQRVGGKVLAIPHNSNLARGRMFALTNFNMQPLTKAYAKTRARWEPLLEVTQNKGDSETHPLVSPDDEFADFETQGKFANVAAGKQSKPAAQSKAPKKASAGKKTPAQTQAKAPQKKPAKAVDWQEAPEQSPVELAAQSYARSALKLGMDQQSKLGTNPFKFGMIGSTDSHTGLTTGYEDNFWGGLGVAEPSQYRAAIFSHDNASGYAAVWAHENTRASLFAAMRRKETYATTGPRMTVRFFGGWDYATDDAIRPDLARLGYAKGVPMGGDLTVAPAGQSPNFLIRAVKDPDGANLDRVQVIKGWRDTTGALHEQVYDVALSDERKLNAKGKAEPVGNTVNVAEASYTNSIGDPELAIVWTDPNFNAKEAAFYYVRVLEIPTPRWTAYDAKRYGIDLPEETPMITQDRAYTSPIWYTP